MSNRLMRPPFWMTNFIPPNVFRAASVRSDQVFVELVRAGKNVGGAGADAYMVFLVALGDYVPDEVVRRHGLEQVMGR